MGSDIDDRNPSSRSSSPSVAGPDGTDDLVAKVYDELRRIARHRLAQLPPGQSLQPTELVHEAYARLAGGGRWQGDRHFVNAAAQAMRNVLIDRLRGRDRAKRGGGERPVPLESVLLPALSAGLIRSLSVAEALAELAAAHGERKRQIAEMRCYLGLTVAEIATQLEVAPTTVERDWRLAKAWLTRRLGDDPPGST